MALAQSFPNNIYPEVIAPDNQVKYIKLKMIVNIR